MEAIPTNNIEMIWYVLVGIGVFLTTKGWDWFVKRDEREDNQQQEKWAASDRRHKEFYDMIERIVEKFTAAIGEHTSSLSGLTASIQRMMDHEERMLDSLSRAAARDENTQATLSDIRQSQQELQKSVSLLLAKVNVLDSNSATIVELDPKV